MKKIAILTNSLDPLDGGWGRYSRELATHLKKSGQDLVVFVEGERGHAPQIIEGITVIPGLKTGSNPTLLNLWSIVQDYLWLKNQMKDVDLIHAFVEHHIFAASMLRKPYVVTAHGTYAPLYLSHPMYKYFARNSFSKAKACLCVSEFTRTKVLEAMPQMQNTQFIPNGVDTEKFAIQKIEKVPGFITVGALKRRKGQDTTIRAFAKVAKEFPSATCTIVGDQTGPFFDTLKELAVTLQISNQVHFVSDITDEELVHLYNQSLAFVLSSRVDNWGNFEGFGLVFLEAGACGIPMLGTTGGGAAPIIKDGENGFLFEPEDELKLSEHMRYLLSHPEQSKRMGQNARVLAESFSWSDISTKVVNVYNS